MATGSTSLDRPRDLRIVEDLEGFTCALPDRDASRQIQRRILYFHLIMMALFITVVLAIPAWLAAGANILLSAQLVSWRLRCTAHGVELGRLYTRADPSVAELRSEAKIKGPKPLGLGQPEQPTFLPFSELERVEWNEWSLTFHMADGGVHQLGLELTPPADIARLGRRIQQVFEGYSAGVTVSREQADQDRQRLAAMARASVRQGS